MVTESGTDQQKAIGHVVDTGSHNAFKVQVPVKIKEGLDDMIIGWWKFILNYWIGSLFQY